MISFLVFLEKMKLGFISPIVCLRVLTLKHWLASWCTHVP